MSTVVSTVLSTVVVTVKSYKNCKQFPHNFVYFALNQNHMFLFSLVQTDARVANDSASSVNGDRQKFVAAKQWKKVEEATSKLTMAMAASKRAADELEDLQTMAMAASKRAADDSKVVMSCFCTCHFRFEKI